MIESIAMRRILKMEKKNRKNTNVKIEAEFLLAMALRGLDRNNTINIALEKHLRDINIDIPQSIPEPSAEAMKAMA